MKRGQNKGDNMTDTDQSLAADKPFPLVWPSLAWAVLYFVLQLVIGIVAIAIVIVPVAMHDHNWAQHVPKGPGGFLQVPGIPYAIFASIIVPAAIMMLIFWRVLRVNGRAAKMGVFAPSHLSLVKTLGLGAALLVVAWVTEHLYSQYIYDMKDAQQFVQMLITGVPNTVPNLVIKILAIVVAGPVVEEFLFRGYLQNALKAKLPLHVAMALTALIFALYHLQLAATPALMIVGLAIGYFYHYTGSLKWSIALHMLNNFIALASAIAGS